MSNSAAAPPSGRPSEEAAEAAHDHPVGDSIARAVKVGYEVIAENIQQGRTAAQRFRKGDYNVREAPGDIETAALRLIHLARELSTTTLDVCERLLKELGTQRPGEDRTRGVPPFHPTAKPAPAPPSTAATDAGLMKVTVRFSGAPAIARSSTLNRPRRPTAPTEITATPLASRNAKDKAISAVTFETDVSVEGLVAIVNVPRAQPPGVYSGLVYAKGDEAPLGVLTIEVTK
jgi:hypothetical protein